MVLHQLFYSYKEEQQARYINFINPWKENKNKLPFNPRLRLWPKMTLRVNLT